MDGKPVLGFTGQAIPLTQAKNLIKYDYMKIQSKTSRSLAVVKIGVSRQVAIPKKLHDQLGLAPGDYLQVEVEGDRLILTPKALIEKRLAESLDDIREGRVHGPFRSASALLRSLHRTKKSKAS
jgi:AbrB family looped-hinge helix DNA binding protein